MARQTGKKQQNMKKRKPIHMIYFFPEYSIIYNNMFLTHAYQLRGLFVAFPIQNV